MKRFACVLVACLAGLLLLAAVNVALGSPAPAGSLQLPPTPPEPVKAPGDVVINEIAWSGTAANWRHEWIELFNRSGITVSLEGWQLVDGETIAMTLTGEVAPHDFYLIERVTDNVISDVDANWFGPWGDVLATGGEVLTLTNDVGDVVDTANGDGGAWPAGTVGTEGRRSMERINPNLEDTDANWCDNNGVITNGLDADGDPVTGTVVMHNSCYPDLIIYVDKSSSGGTEDGTSWATAFRDLQDALAATSAGYEVWVAEGVYTPTVPAGRDATFEIPDGVALYGGFPSGGGDGTFGARDWVLYPTVLSGDLAGDDLVDAAGVVTDAVNIEGDNAYTVVTTGWIGRSTVLDGFSVTGGVSDGSSCPGNGCGGGIVTMGSLVLRHAVVSGNRATPVFMGGGGIHLGGGPSATAELMDVTFRGNDADPASGGGARIVDAAPTLIDVIFEHNRASTGGGLSAGVAVNTHVGPWVHLVGVTFTGNEATYGDYSDGGGMVAYGGVYTFENVTFVGNTASDMGGGLHVRRTSTPTLSHVTFLTNTADQGGGLSAEIYNGEVSTLTLQHVSFRGNHALSFRGGGGMFVEGCGGTLRHVEFEDNEATVGGGGLNVTWDDDTHVANRLWILDTDFVSNTAEQGGGLHCYACDIALANVTFVRNTATGSPASGGGAYLDNATSRLVNIAFFGNEGSHGGGLYFARASDKLENVVMSGNSATDDGGGLYASDSDPTLVNVTLSGNSAGDEGGGIMLESSATAVFTNAVLWGNEAPRGSQARGDYYTFTYSIVAGEHDPSSHVYGWDPIFVDADGPDDQLGTWDDDLRLVGTSPAIDAGRNAAVSDDVLDLDGDGITTETLPVDLANGPRFVDHFRPDSGDGAPPLVDLGAYEAAPNAAPVLDNSGAAELDPIDQDDLENPGTLVADLIASVEPGLDMITDTDHAAIEGIAVISLDTSHGSWQYTTSSGEIWTTFGVVSDTSSVLLGAGFDDRLRFLPDVGWHGTMTDSITFRAWDQADGWASGTSGVDVSANGGATAYSAATEAAELTVRQEARIYLPLVLNQWFEDD